MKILVIFTGGTIGSTLYQNSISPDQATQSQLIAHFQNNSANQKITFETLSPLNILSENLQPSDWTTIIETIKAQELTSYEGIIVTHGTDTLAFTANALALTLSTLELPLILVSAHTPLDDPNTNAHQNFKAAIACIEHKLSGIFASYQNPHEDFVSIFHAHELTQSLQLSSHFQALKRVHATFKDDTLHLSHEPMTYPDSLQHALKPLFSDEILYIKPYPGIDYSNFNLENHNIILHDLYHSGTCDTNRLKPFIRQCKRQNILLVMAPIQKAQSYYETTQELIDMGVHFLYDISIEHALVKLMLASQNFSTHEEILEYLI